MKRLLVVCAIAAAAMIVGLAMIIARHRAGPARAGPVVKGTTRAGATPAFLPNLQCQKRPVSDAPGNIRGLVSINQCHDDAAPADRTVIAYQFATPEDLGGALAVFNGESGFDPSASNVAETCPPPDGFVAGQLEYDNGFGQLECYPNVSGGPVYVWTVPPDRALIIVLGGSGETFGQVDAWWKDVVGRATSPAP
jgi:hypothetical protein